MYERNESRGPIWLVCTCVRAVNGLMGKRSLQLVRYGVRAIEYILLVCMCECVHVCDFYFGIVVAIISAMIILCTCVCVCMSARVCNAFATSQKLQQNQFPGASFVQSLIVASTNQFREIIEIVCNILELPSKWATHQWLVLP